jgi:hypothetical protein
MVLFLVPTSPTTFGEAGHLTRIEKSAPRPPRCLDRNHQQGANHKRHAERAKNIKQKPQDIGGCPHPLNNPAIAQKCLPQRRSSLGPLNPFRNVGRRVGLGGNDVPAKLCRFPNGNVTAPEAPKIFLGNSIKVDVVHAGGDPCRFGAPVIKQHGGGSGDSSSALTRMLPQRGLPILRRGSQPGLSDGPRLVRTGHDTSGETSCPLSFCCP